MRKWSPDASLIAYCSNDVSGVQSDDWDVVVTSLDGRWQQLTDHPARDYPYAWSPDGRTLVFTSERDGANRAWLMRSDGTGQRRLTLLHSSYETVVDWLPDGRLLVAIDSPDDGLFGWYVVTSDGDVVGLITTVPVSVCCGEGQLDYWAP